MLPTRFKHQDEMFNKALHRNYYAFFCEMGLGKTRVAIELSLARGHKTLIIAPNTVLENWQQEIIKWSEGTRKGIILQGSKEERRQLLKLNAQFFIINYEALRILEEELIQAGFQCVVADESVKLKGYKTLQSKAGFRIAQAIPFRIIMTGSPVTNNPLDLFGQFRFLEPRIFGSNFFRFRATYAIMGGYMNYQVQKWINLDRLKNTVLQHGCVYLKKDCLDLPDKIYEKVYIDLTDEQKQKYDELRKEFITEFQGEVVLGAVVLTRLIRFSQITSGFLKVNDDRELPFSKNPKLDWVEDFLKERHPDTKVIIFCRFIHDVKTLEKLCERLKIGSVSIYGETKERQEAINKFNAVPTCRVFIGQVQTAGLGINLTAASYVIYYSNSYSYGDRIQSEDRAHRIGQVKNVTYIDLICRKTIDEQVGKALQIKQDLASFIIGKEVKNII